MATASGPTAFEFMRGAQRRFRHQAATATAGFGGHMGGSSAGADSADHNLFGPVEQQLHFPLSEGVVATDEQRGLWWAVQGQKVYYFPLVGLQWPPVAVHTLPDNAALSNARCVALLSRSSSGSAANGGQTSVRTVRSTGLGAVVVLSDMSLAVFPQGNRVDVPRPATAPLGQVPLFALAAASHYSGPGEVGVVLVVGTLLGRLFSLILRQCGDNYQAEAGPLWPTCSEGSGLGHRFLKRVRRSFGVEAEQAVEDSAFSAAQVLPVPSGASADTLFAALVWGTGAMALYVQSQSAKGAALVWRVSVLDLMGGLPGTLLAACPTEEGSVMLVYQGRASPETILARLPWTTSWQQPPQPSSGTAAVIGSGSVGQTAFLCTLGRTTVAAVRLDDQRCLLSTAYLTPHGLQVIEKRTVEMGILSLCFAIDASASSNAGTVVAVTPHGLVAQGRPADLDQSRRSGASMHTELPFPSDVLAALRTAFECYAVGQEDWAAGVGRQWRDFLQSREPHQLDELLEALDRRTSEMLDMSDTSGPRWRNVSDSVVTRYLLFEKARELEVWLQFLAETGVWTRLGGVPGELAMRQATVEACERVFVLSRLRELDDKYPEVFQYGIHAAVSQQAIGSADTGSMNTDREAHRFYAKVSACERFLVALEGYPRSQPLGSSGAVDAVVLANGIASTFLEAALERREQVLSTYPTLLPAPELRPRYLQGAALPPRSLGSSWLVSGRMMNALEVLRRLSLEVLPDEQVRGLPLLAAQALRVVQSLRALCLATLRVAHATYANLHCMEMARLRHAVLKHLMEAEAALAPSAGPHSALLLAEEFEDFDAIVDICVDAEPQRLQHHLEESESFRIHALAKFVRVQRLRPLFFRTIERFPMPPAQIKELFAREGCPELYWVMEVHKLDELSREAIWQPALREVERCATESVQAEKHSAARREMFAALAKLARAAQGEDSPSQPGNAVVEDLACLARLHKICRRAADIESDAAGATAGEEAVPSPMAVESWEKEPPATVEKCVEDLGCFFQVALTALREESAEGAFLADVVQLILLVEQALVKRGADLGTLLDPGAERETSKDVETVRALQRIWFEAVMSDINTWCSLLVGYPGGSERDEIRSHTVFYRMLAGARSGPMHTQLWPQSASVAELCGVCEQLQQLQPELHLVQTAAHDAFAAKVAMEGEAVEHQALVT